jgi:hypothetical protein
MSATATAHDHLTEVIAQAIGANDPYPSPVQLAVHRAKQDLKEKQCPSTDLKETTE